MGVAGADEDRFRQVVEAAPNAMVMVNAAGRIEMVNAQAERVFGYARSELLGEPVEMLVPERFRGGHPGLRSAFFDDHFDALVHKIAPNARIGPLPQTVAEFAARTALASLRNSVKHAGG